jgi:DNA-binding NtrC family response regulator
MRVRTSVVARDAAAQESIDLTLGVCEDWIHGGVVLKPTALIVDEDPFVIERLRPIAESAGYSVSGHMRFDTARRQLRRGQTSAVVANVRLAAFNGIHLAYLAKTADSNVRALVYANPHDPVLAREAQRVNAFYEHQAFLPYSLKGFLEAGLPTSDRRNASRLNRRTVFRSGRRATDVAVLHTTPATA